jgi:hypothetical protein
MCVFKTDTFFIAAVGGRRRTEDREIDIAYERRTGTRVPSRRRRRSEVSGAANESRYGCGGTISEPHLSTSRFREIRAPCFVVVCFGVVDGVVEPERQLNER